MYNVDIVDSIDQPDHKVGEFCEVSCSSQINSEVHDPLDYQTSRTGDGRSGNSSRYS